MHCTYIKWVLLLHFFLMHGHSSPSFRFEFHFCHRAFFYWFCGATSIEIFQKKNGFIWFLYLEFETVPTWLACQSESLSPFPLSCLPDFVWCFLNTEVSFADSMHPDASPKNIENVDLCSLVLQIFLWRRVLTSVLLETSWTLDLKDTMVDFKHLFSSRSTAFA